MQRIRRPLLRAPLWVFAIALLLRAAMPFLASASAELQGRSVGEICTVHGVVLDAKRPGDPAEPAANRPGDGHCLLGALAVLATGDAPPLPTARAQSSVADPALTVASSPRHDATADWVAKRKHGPPALA